VSAEAREEVRAAGGAVARVNDEGELELAAIHRPKYDDWSLPKGKLEPGEGWEEAAVREVEEETGLQVELGPPLGETRYVDPKGRPKLVRYWEMTSVGGEFRPNREADEHRWVTVEQAEALLTHERDRELVARLAERRKAGGRRSPG
jgi:8-oxo-dGTP pyrophosphatase MutT (NUDIX family)